MSHKRNQEVSCGLSHIRMQNLGEDCLDVDVYCFKSTSYQGWPDINIEYMLFIEL